MDTAQPAMAAETDRNAQLADGAEAFKAFMTEQPVQPRASNGQFASDAEEVPEAEAGEEQPLETGEIDDDDEAADDAQPLPSSWPADKAELWDAIPAEARGFIAERDAEATRAVNAKFQDAANVRKAAEAAHTEAATHRKQYAEALDTLMAAIQPVKPDPRQYGLGTGQYHQEAYELAKYEYDSAIGTFAQLQEQRQALTAEQAQAEDQQFDTWKAEHEAQFAPKFVADVPDLTDGAKAEPLMRGLVAYAIESGIPESAFAEGEQKFITSAQLHILWKAMQFDKARTAPAAAKPKPGPVVKPGVSSPRSAQKAAQRTRISDRLSQTGSVEDGAAMFKLLMKGTF